MERAEIEGRGPVSSRQAIIIHNANAGVSQPLDLRERVSKILQQYGVQAEFHATEGGRRIAELVGDAVGRRTFAVVAAGGDGTVSSVAAGLVGSDTALGVLPVGTLNHFAHDMHIPLGPDEAAHTIGAGLFQTIDVGEVNGKFFLNNSSLGLYPSVVRGRDQQQRLGRSKRAALLWATLAALRRHRSASVSVVSDDGTSVTCRTPLVFVGNNRYEMNGLKIGSRTSLEAGKLAIYVLRRDGALNLIRLGIEAVIGRLRDGVDFDFLLVDSARIDLPRSTVQVANDGEISTFVPPLIYRAHPHTLRVLAPAKTD